MSVAVGLILLAGTVSLFIANRRTYQATEDLSRLQEDARFALESLIRDLQMAGHVGCHHDLDAVTNLSVDEGGAVHAFGVATGGGPPGPGVAGTNEVAETSEEITPPSGWSLVAGSDSVTARYLVSPGAPLVFRSRGPRFVASRDPGLVPGDLAAVTDCVSTTVFRVGAVQHMPAANRWRVTVADDGTTTRDYPAAGANRLVPAVTPVRTHRYYLARDPFGTPHLRRQTATGDQAIAAGAEHLEVIYGVDLNQDGRPERYVAPGDAELDSPDDWRRVVGVRIGLLLRTAEFDTGTERERGIGAYDLFTGRASRDLTTCRQQTGNSPGCVAVENPDLRVRRRVFTTTVRVRNET